MFKSGISSLAPDKEMRVFFDHFGEHTNQGLPMMYEVKLSDRGFDRRKYSHVTHIDIEMTTTPRGSRGTGSTRSTTASRRSRASRLIHRFVTSRDEPGRRPLPSLSELHGSGRARTIQGSGRPNPSRASGEDDSRLEPHTVRGPPNLDTGTYRERVHLHPTHEPVFYILDGLHRVVVRQIETMLLQDAFAGGPSRPSPPSATATSTRPPSRVGSSAWR
jgi:hypothetical protein